MREAVPAAGSAGTNKKHLIKHDGRPYIVLHARPLKAIEGIIYKTLYSVTVQARWYTLIPNCSTFGIKTGIILEYFAGIFWLDIPTSGIKLQNLE